MLTDIIGWIGALCIGACGIPQATQCVRQGHAEGLSLCFLLLWLSGEVGLMTASILEFGWVWWLMVNYILNILCLMIIFRYRFWPK
jgi:uncharacterized protein with PQ loop repeat